jgi:hypothetical protein
MKKLILNKGEGKTIRAIKESANTRYPIVCVSSAQCKSIQEIARKMSYNIPEPLNFKDYPNNTIGRQINGFIIDDADLLLQELFLNKVWMLTMNKEKNDELCQN